jgi:surface carbohydrate biosynthesis protein
MVLAKQYGHHIVAMEEECMAISGETALSKNSSNLLYDGNVDCIFATGEFEKKYHESRSNKKQKINIIGNPRIDLLKKEYFKIFEEKVLELNEQYQDYILINTNFGYLNSIWGEKNRVRNIQTASGAIDPTNQESIHDYDIYIEWEKICHDALKKSILTLSSLWSEKNFIIRPHPGEDLDKVANEYQGIKNIKIIREGSHVPYTLGSDLLIHTSCTTGLEAFLANKTAVSLVPKSIWYSDQILSNLVNKVCSSDKDLISFVNSKLSEQPLKNSIFKNELVNLDFYIDNIGSHTASNKIAEYFDKLIFKKVKDNFKYYPPLKMMPFQITKCQINKNSFLKLLDVILKIEKIEFKIIETISIHELAESLFYIKGSHSS